MAQVVSASDENVSDRNVVLLQWLFYVKCSISVSVISLIQFMYTTEHDKTYVVT